MRRELSRRLARLAGGGNWAAAAEAGLARLLLESPGGARPIASMLSSLVRSASTSTSTSSSTFFSSSFHSSPSSRQQIEDVVRDPLPSSKENAAPTRNESSSGGDAFLSLPTVRAATRGPLSMYASRRRAGLYRKDPRQEGAMLELQRLFDDLEANAAPPQGSGLTMVEAIGDDRGGGGSWLSSLFGPAGDAFSSDSSSSSSFSSSSSSSSSAAPRGLYMYGGVGTGKTMLMDVFSECATPLVPTRRVHFHDFMLDVHARLRARSRVADPLRAVAADLAPTAASGPSVLCLDELFVHDVADAAILSRLFACLWGERKLVLVATSNRAPDKLYENGLQRALFLPFIASLKQRCVAHDMESAVDYRKLAHAHRGLWFAMPDWPDPDKELGERFREVVAAPGCHSGGETGKMRGSGVVSGGSEMATPPPPAPRSVPVMMGRELRVPLAGGSAAYFPFGDLCGKPLGSADFIALCENFHTLALADVPLFSNDNSAAAARFVALVDTAYDHRVRLFASARGQPADLFAKVLSQAEAKEASKSLSLPADALVDDNLAFSKERTISRLIEMQSLSYLMDHARLHAPVLLPALEELQEKEGKASLRRN